MVNWWNVFFIAVGMFGIVLSWVMVCDYVRNHINGPWFEPVAMAAVSIIAIFVGIVGRFQ
jgi:hypothetical protein